MQLLLNYFLCRIYKDKMAAVRKCLFSFQFGKSLAGNLHGNRPLGRYRSPWKDNIKEVKFQGVDWTQLSQDKIQ
jgi:hypothetical protein